MNSQTRSGKASSLHRAAYSGHSGVLKTLITHGADPRLCDSDGQTALHKVNGSSCFKIASLILW